MAIFRSGQEVTASVWTESYSEGLSFAVFLAFGSSGSATDAPMLTKPILIRHEGFSMVEASLRAHAPGFLRCAKLNLNLHRSRRQVARRKQLEDRIDRACLLARAAFGAKVVVDIASLIPIS